MTDAPTPAQRLADHLLGRPLAEYVAEKRSAEPQWSWRRIANRLSSDTDGQVDVAGETLRLWFRDDTEVAA